MLHGGNRDTWSAGRQLYCCCAAALPISWMVVTVPVADCGLHHATRALEGEWWTAGDAVRAGV
jgi:hypothetical protein